MYLFKISISLILLIIGINVETPSAQTLVSSKYTQPSIIQKIIINGNRITKKSTVLALFELDSGMVFDSLKVKEGEKNLERTRLFNKVDVFSLFKEDGAYVYIMLEEKFYLFPDGGGELSGWKYGKKETWWKLELGLQSINFRGRMESMNISGSIWDSKGLLLSWYKPILSTPYFFTLGARIDSYPDEVRPTDHLSVSSKIIAGRKLFTHSRVMLGMFPYFRRDVRTIFYPETEIVKNIDTLQNRELLGVLAFVSDFRNSTFDTKKGWYLYTDIQSNLFYPGKYVPYFQSTTDFRFYHPGIFPENKVAYHVVSLLRNTDAGPFHYLQYGGEGSIRGYAGRALGNYFAGNNSVLLSMEYRFPIYKFPELNLPIISHFFPFFASIGYQLDGALIFDYGRISKTISDLYSPSGSPTESGTGIGAGLRVSIPSMERTVCLDVVWGENNRTETINFFKKPILHLYLDMSY